MPTEPALVRAMGFWALAASIVNVTIGGSIFALPGTLAGALGAAAPLAFVAGALLFVPIVWCFAAAGSRVTVTGGPYSYVAAAFGALPAFATAAFLWLSSVAGSATLAAILADQLAQVMPAFASPLPRTAFMLGLYGVLIGLNARGVKVGARVILGFALAKVVPLVVVACAGAGLVQAHHLAITSVPSWKAIGASLVIVVFAYSGIETALAPSGEVRDPARTIPRAALAGVGVVILLYVGLQLVAQGVLGDGLSGTSAPLAAIAERLVGGGDRFLVLVAAVSLFGCLQGDLLGSSRLLYALARDGFLPARFARLTAVRRVPLWAVALHALAGWVLASLGSFATLALVSGGAFCLVYIGGCAAAWQLERRSVGGTVSTVRLPGGACLPLLAIVGLCSILCTLQRAEWFAIACTVLLTGAVYAGSRGSRRGRDAANVSRAP